MKILYCLAGTFNSGGMERIVTAKANWLSKNGYDVTIVTTEQNYRPDFYPLHGVKRIDTNIMYSDTLKLNPLKKLFVRSKLIHKHKKALVKIVEEIQPDIIISTFGNEVSFIPKLKDKSKKIVEIHFSRWFRLQAKRPGIWKLIDKYLTWKDYQYVKMYDKFVSLTNEDSKNWGKLKNITVIPNFIENNNSEPALLSNKKMISVGRLDYQKGFDRLIKAWKDVNDSYPDWMLNIYGSGPLREDLINLVNSLNLQDSIKINEPTKEIIDKYRQHSALIISSHYEGLPMIMLEAMEVGLPIISYDCPCGPKDVIENQINGILVPNNSISRLAESIKEIIASPSKRKEMGKKAYETSRQFFANEIMPKWDSLFLSLVDK